MNRLLENPKLANELDFNGFDLKNAGDFTPAPSNLVSSDDTRLTDGRPVPNDSVTDESVSPVAAIQQDKLDLDGDIPVPWLGDGSGEAAQGDLVERITNKGVAGGYAALDSNGRIATADLPTTGPDTGTLSEVGLSMPSLEFDVTVKTVNSGAGTLTAVWQDQPDNSWFGVFGPVGMVSPMDRPSFLTKQIPPSIIPDLDAAKFTTGTFPVSMFPVVVGMGVGHMQGLLPDPGLTVDDTGDPTDYLGRDGTWKRVNTDNPIQPQVPNVQITLLSYFNGQARIRLYCPLKNSLIFYLALNPLADPPPQPYNETANPTVILVNPFYTVVAYAAKAGYNNSSITNFTVPQHPTLSS